jgi:hypothetical protein
MVKPIEIIGEWVIQDILVLFVGIYTIIFIIKHEQHSVSIILELFSFVFLYAAVYENLASYMEWYKFGRSIVMLFNVPITVPLMEYLMVYGGIRLGIIIIINFIFK